MADLNDDGSPDLLVGDGWHFAYAEQARARLLLLEGPEWSEGRTLGFFSDDYSVRSIERVGDGILAVGTKRVYWLSQDELGWAATAIAEVSETGLATAVETPQGPGVLVSGTPARVVPIPQR